MRLSDGVEHVVNCMVNKNNENFNNNANGGAKPGDRQFGIIFVITYIVMLVILLLIGKYLWNNILTKLVTVVNKADSVVDILGLAILVSILNL